MEPAAISFHVNEDCKAATLGDSGLGELRIMTMAVHSGSPLHGASIDVGATGGIHSQTHVDEPALIVPDVILVDAVFLHAGHEPGTEGVVIAGNRVSHLLEDSRIGGIAVERALQQPEPICR